MQTANFDDEKFILEYLKVDTKDSRVFDVFERLVEKLDTNFNSLLIKCRTAANNQNIFLFFDLIQQAREKYSKDMLAPHFKYFLYRLFYEHASFSRISKFTGINKIQLGLCRKAIQEALNIWSYLKSVELFKEWIDELIDRETIFYQQAQLDTLTISTTSRLCKSICLADLEKFNQQELLVDNIDVELIAETNPISLMVNHLFISFEQFQEFTKL